MILLSYISKRIKEREAKDKSSTTEVFHPSNNTEKLHWWRVYNINDVKDPTVRQGKSRPPNKRLKAFTKVHNKIGSTSNCQQVNIDREEMKLMDVL